MFDAKRTLHLPCYEGDQFPQLHISTDSDLAEDPVSEQSHVRPTLKSEPFHFRFPLVKVLVHMPGRFMLGFLGMAAVASSWCVGVGDGGGWLRPAVDSIHMYIQIWI